MTRPPSDLAPVQPLRPSGSGRGFRFCCSVARLGVCCAAVAALTSAAGAAGRRPLALHPDNPHYFLFRGKPAVLLTSGEHYGAVLNRDFAYRPYLDELQRRRFNLTRLFLGVYAESPGTFKIHDNTLGPAPGRLICPWKRSDRDGYAGGGPKFDLARWDDAYFERLRDFVAQAGRRGIVVEAVLFCPYYDDSLWRLSPLHAQNNVNHVSDVPRTEVLTMRHPELVAYQDAYVRQITGALRDADNVYFEICNEPYFGGVTPDWQAHVAGVITQAEASLPVDRRHLIAQNIANGSARVEQPNPAVSILNFHYAAPPDAVGLNYGLDRAIAFDETGFRGSEDRPYRTEGWDFFFAGGAVYDNLDYSFTPLHPGGTAPVAPPTPGGGGPELRRQLTALGEFLRRLPLVRMRPDRDVVRGPAPAGTTVRFLSEPGKVYAGYLRGGTQVDLQLALVPGDYRAEWIEPRSGRVVRTDRFRATDQPAHLASPRYTEDLALRLTRR